MADIQRFGAGHSCEFFFLRIVLYPLGLFLGTGPELVSSPVSYERYSGCLRVKSKDHGVR